MSARTSNDPVFDDLVQGGRTTYIRIMDTNPKIPSEPDPPEAAAPPPEPEIGGPKERDPTRYGDWTVKGRCIDF